MFFIGEQTYFIIVLFLSRKDVSDGHTTDGFFDGSGRSRHPEGKELKVPRGKGDGNQLPSQKPTKHLFKELGRWFSYWIFF